MLTNQKRITILCGHYGTGKTNVAVNLALAMTKTDDNVTVADLDIVNPYFRTLDSAAAFDAAGIRLICSRFANSNVDIPSLPPDLYAITDDKSHRVVIDVGGDEGEAGGPCCVPMEQGHGIGASRNRKDKSFAVFLHAVAFHGFFRRDLKGHRRIPRGL